MGPTKKLVNHHLSNIKVSITNDACFVHSMHEIDFNVCKEIVVTVNHPSNIKNCSTPNPYPSPIHPVEVSIIIVKISSLLLPTPPVKHLCRKNSIAEPPIEISTSNFLGYAHI